MQALWVEASAGRQRMNMKSEMMTGRIKASTSWTSMQFVGHSVAGSLIGRVLHTAVMASSTHKRMSAGLWGLWGIHSWKKLLGR